MTTYLGALVLALTVALAVLTPGPAHANRAQTYCGYQQAPVYAYAGTRTR